jgi:hypothetical protein
MSSKTLYHKIEIADRIGLELDALRNHVKATRGQGDSEYILKVIRRQRTLVLLGQVSMGIALGFHPTFSHSLTGWAPLVGGLLLEAIFLVLAKIRENMESATMSSMDSGTGWVIQKSNRDSGSGMLLVLRTSGSTLAMSSIIHHSWTNIVGRDQDGGYGIMRMSSLQPCEPRYLGHVFYNFALVFEKAQIQVLIFLAAAIGLIV